MAAKAIEQTKHVVHRELAFASVHELDGASVRVEAVDVADRTALGRLFDSIAGTMPPLQGIVHAAGVLDDGVLVQQTWHRFERVFRPKLQGAWNLHELSASLPLKRT